MEVTKVKQSKNNTDIEYIEPKELRDLKTVYSQALFTRIKVNEKKKLSLKIGRYKKSEWYEQFIKTGIPEVSYPKSELTLDPEELDNLVTYINANYYPLSNDEISYLSLDENTASKLIKDNPENISQLIKVAIENEIDLTDVNKLIEIADRKKALKEFAKHFKSNALESVWQKWFQKNYWVFGSDFVRVSKDRRIDVENISDFIAENIDGFVDVIEIKRPGDSTNFFESSKDHGNLVPSTDLIKAITQLSNYLCTLESKSNEIDTTKRLGKILKPRGILIYGNSRDWQDDEFEALRLLNFTLNNISIYTYDMVYRRAIKMNEYLSNSSIGSFN